MSGNVNEAELGGAPDEVQPGKYPLFYLRVMRDGHSIRIQKEHLPHSLWFGTLRTITQDGTDVTCAAVVDGVFAYDKEPGFDSLAKLASTDQQFLHCRIFRWEVAQALLFLNWRIEEVERERKRLAASAIAELNGKKPTYGYGRELSKVMETSVSLLNQRNQLALSHKAVLELDCPYQKTVDALRILKTNKFADGPWTDCPTSSRQYCVPCPKQHELNKRVRGLAYHETWRKILYPFQIAQRQTDERVTLVFAKSWPFVLVRAIVFSLLCVFVIVPITTIASGALQQVGVTTLLIVLCCIGSVLTQVLEPAGDGLLLLFLAYAAILCTLQQVASQKD